MHSRRDLLAGLAALPLGARPFAATAPTPARQLIRAARAQIGVTTGYDPAYVRLDYPGGDVPRETGVCIDVIIRAYREASGFDFQRAIHEDMAASFDAYPKSWGLNRPDRNIDHRRVPNLETWLTRHGHERAPTHWRPGDLLTCRVPGNLPHIGLITDRRGVSGDWLAVHNIGRGAREEALIGRWSGARRFRFLPDAAMRAE